MNETIVVIATTEIETFAFHTFAFHVDDLDLDFLWDVTAAGNLDQEAPWKILCSDLAPVVEMIENGQAEVDKAKAEGYLGNPDVLNRPAIVVRLPFIGTHVMIDGWHRCWAWHLQDEPMFPFVLLSPEQERAVRLAPSDADIQDALARHPRPSPS